MSSLRLVTRADDAGTNRTTNRAILASVREGIARNVSLMAPAPHIEHAAETLLGLADEIDFGLHVTLTAEWQNLRWGPVSDPSSVRSIMRRDQTFPASVADFNLLHPDIDEIMVEVAAQYDRLVGLGFKLSFLNEHMMIGTLPSLGERLNEFARERELVSDRQLVESDRLATLPGWSGPGEHPGTELADHLSGIESGTHLLVGHPGYKEEEMQRLRMPGHAAGEAALQRNRERRMFMDIEIVDYCQNTRIELLRYTDLG